MRRPQYSCTHVLSFQPPDISLRCSPRARAPRNGLSFVQLFEAAPNRAALHARSVIRSVDRAQADRPAHFRAGAREGQVQDNADAIVRVAGQLFIMALLLPNAVALTKSTTYSIPSRQANRGIGTAIRRSQSFHDWPAPPISSENHHLTRERAERKNGRKPL